jgi:hypothetical protein
MKTALLIGINYLNTAHELGGCINDIIDIDAVLTTNYGFTNMVHLTDETALKPTKSNIIAQLQEKIAHLKAEDTFILYYSGHGTYIADTNSDETDQRDEAMYTLDNQLITDDELFTILQASPANNYVFLDCCHSGTLCDLEYNIRPTLEKKTYKLWLEPKETQSRICMFSGCLDTQTSADAAFYRSEKEYKNNGAFTFMLLSALKENNYVPIRNKTLLTTIYSKLKVQGFSQIPQLSSSHLAMFNDNFLS